MGLAFTHCEARWSYSGFMRFRVRLGKMVGIDDLHQMRGFGGTIEWGDLESHPLYPLLSHSDCDGELSPEECARVYPALLEHVVDWPENDYDRMMALELAEGMKEAYENDEDLEFY